MRGGTRVFEDEKNNFRSVVSVENLSHWPKRNREEHHCPESTSSQKSTEILWWLELSMVVQ